MTQKTLFRLNEIMILLLLWWEYISVRQTTWNDISLLFYASVCWSTYQMSQKYKIDKLFDVSNHFFLNRLFSWEFSKWFFLQNQQEEWNKKICCSKKNFTVKTQVILFLNLKDIIERGGVSVMLNLYDSIYFQWLLFIFFFLHVMRWLFESIIFYWKSCTRIDHEKFQKMFFNP